MDQLFRMVNIKNKLNKTKIGGAIKGVFHPRALRNSSFFAFLVKYMKLLR